MYLHLWVLHRLVVMWRLNDILDREKQAQIKRELTMKFSGFIVLYSILYLLSGYYSYHISKGES